MLCFLLSLRLNISQWYWVLYIMITIMTLFIYPDIKVN